MTGWLARIKAGAISVLAFLMVTFAVWRAGRAKGKAEQRAEHTEDAYRKQAETDKEVAEVHDEINKLPDGSAADRLKSDWLRRDKD